jgi:catechol-2,3-dioxygenase
VGGATRRDSWRALFASLPPPNVTTRAKAHPAPSGPVGSIRGVTALEETQTAAPITGLSHFQLLVTDVDVSARWYTAALGLLPFAQGPVPAGGSDEPAPQYLDHLAFAVPDGESLNVWADHLTEIGVAHDGIVLENGHPSLQLRDPDGIAIELVAP